MVNSVFTNRGFPENDAKADKSLHKSAWGGSSWSSHEGPRESWVP